MLPLDPCHRFLFACALGLAGCPPGADPADSGALRDTAGGGEGSYAVVATVADDYSVGALSIVSVADWSVEDQVTTISGDPAVFAHPEWVFLLNRENHDTVRVYEPGVWSDPLVEFSAGEGANPQAAALCGDRLWVTTYDTDTLPWYDPETGLRGGTVDLSPWADADGLPEAATLVEKDGRLIVALNRLDRDRDWTALDEGRVLEVDCAAGEVTREWTTGPNPSVHDWPEHAGGVWIRSGAWFEEDGGLSLLDLDAGELGSPVVEEAELGGDLAEFAAGVDHGLAITADEDWTYTTWCLDLSDPAPQKLGTTDRYLSDVAVNDLGEAWIATREGWADPEVEGGLVVVDLATCTSRTGDDRIQTELDPFSLDFY